MTDGFRAVQQALKELPTTIQKKVITGATRAGASVIAKEAKRLAPVDTGTLKLSIGVAKAKKRDTDLNHIKFFVVPKSKVRRTVKAKVDGKNAKIKATAYTYHAHFLEFGTEKMAPQPFLRPAVDSTKAEVVQAFQAYAHKRIDKEIEKMKR